MAENIGTRETDPRIFANEADYVAWLQSGTTDADRDGFRVGPCDGCGIDHDDALTCDEAQAEHADEIRNGVA
jgi:hypothetical protein